MLYLLKQNAKTIKQTIVYKFKIDDIDGFTSDDYKLIVHSDPSCIAYISEKYLTEEICEISVTKYAFNIRYVPDKFITHKICIIAVTQTPYALFYIKKKFLTEEICEKAIVRNNKITKSSVIWQNVPKNFLKKYRVLL